MFTYLNALFYGGKKADSMSLWTFAGLTAGGAGFNAYFNALVDASLVWRIQNSLDIAPFMFDSLSSIKNIYESQNPPLPIDTAADLALDGLFLSAAASGTTYAQPQAGFVMAGDFQADLSWPDQALYQHHASTYQAMVPVAFPVAASDAKKR